MSAKLFLDSSIKFVPQMDLSINGTEEGGIEASQTFLVRKSSVATGSSDLSLFVRGTRWEQVYPEVPSLWRNLTIKTVGEGSEVQPGIIAIKVSFTGYLYANNGSSGDEASIPTTGLRGTSEQFALCRHPKWMALPEDIKCALGKLLSGEYSLNIDGDSPGTWDAAHEFFANAKDSSGAYITFTGNALIFARKIAQGDGTYEHTSWSYNYRTESKTGFTAAQLNQAGKIVANPPGSPVKPGSEWTWLMADPDQTQSGPDRFIKVITFRLIPDNPENQMLYTD